MIKAVDEMLKLWAAELHPPEGVRLGGGGKGSVLATLMATKGEIIRGSSRSACPWDRSADIELIVNKCLPDDLAHLVMVHYTDYDMCDSLKWEACKLRRTQYYQRLNLAHVGIAELLVGRRVA